MPVVTREDTRKVGLTDLADLLDRSKGTISRAAREKYFCAGYPVWEWAEWHPRGSTIRHYEVPVQVLKEVVPKDEWIKYAIFD